MKKLFSVFMLILVAVSLFACKQEEGDPTTLYVQFVPSSSIDTAMLTKLRDLETILEDELLDAGFEINVVITIGTTYQAVVEAMDSGTVHVGFLTAQQYAFATLTYPEKFNVLLTSVRRAYEAQLDAQGNQLSNEAWIANVNAPGYNAAYHATVMTSSYPSMLLVRNEDYDAWKDGGWIEQIKGKTVGTQSTTSGSGYVYPTMLLQENGLKFVSGTPNAANGEVKSQTIGGHQNSVLALLNNEVDAVFTFLDARLHATAYNAWIEANPGKTPFSETKVVALSPQIYNDTITTVASLSDELRDAIADAFIAALGYEAGAAALEIYQHTGYLKADDEDYEGEREVWKFLHPDDFPNG
jgi:phosphonate transport system substrate-binding protein